MKAIDHPAVIEACKSLSRECSKWTKRADDAKRIPDAIYDFAPAIIAAAVEKVLEPYSVLHDAVSKYMQHKNNTQANHCGDRTMDIRMIYRQDVLNALDALNPKEPTPCPPK